MIGYVLLLDRMIVKMNDISGQDHLGLIGYYLARIGYHLSLVASGIDISDSGFFDGRFGPGGI